MNITEKVKEFLNITQEPTSSDVSDRNTLVNLDDEYYVTSFFDSEASQSGLFGGGEVSDIVYKQRDKIKKYRELSMTPDVTDAIDEIVNEIIFNYDDEMPLKINVNEENDKLVEVITDKFNKILKIMNIKRNMFQIVKTGYIDGQIIMHTSYDEKTTKNGIKSIKMIEPSLLFYDKKKEVFKYMQEDKNIMSSAKSDLEREEYSLEEICREDFGLYDGKINLGYLEYSIKPANMLKTLEDLLIPLRFSRSISRRAFNVDIGDLPNKRGAEVMTNYQNKFKYKKFYNNQTGEVSNQQHITSMVEDYWFANRSGGKGTTVDVLDETGNLGELNDILYFSKKLYRSMKIPSNRIDVNPDGDKDYSYDETRVTKEDMKFFMFISRLRQVYSSLFKEILKREVISCGIMTTQEWKDKEDLIQIQFVSENKFIEKMKLDNFMNKLEIYATAQEYQGKLFSVNTILKDVFRFSEDEIQDEFKKINDEEKDPLYGKFYSGDGDDESW